nr:hypothetical protein [Desulfurococcales archaeon]
PRIGVSKKRFNSEILPLLQLMFREGSPVHAARLSLGYGLTREMVELLAGKRAKEILELAEKIKRTRQAEHHTGTAHTEARKAETGEAGKPSKGEEKEGGKRRRRKRKSGEERKGTTLDMFFG